MVVARNFILLINCLQFRRRAVKLYLITPKEVKPFDRKSNIKSRPVVFNKNIRTAK